MTVMSSSIALPFALRYRAAGLSVLPIRSDGSKAPDLPGWEPYQRQIACEEEIRNWYTDPNLGVGIVCGAVSGNLGVMDFEFMDFYLEWLELLEAERPGLAARLPAVITPGKQKDVRGAHVYYRAPAPPAGGKLALITPEEAERRTGDRGQVTAIEVRGEGNQVLAPGTPGHCHPSGRTYEPEGAPDVTETPVLTEDEVDALHRCARVLSRALGARAYQRVLNGSAVNGERPGEEFNRRADWADVLGPHGWQVERQSGGVTYWRRPGKDHGVSATTGHCHSDQTGELLYVFSTNAQPFEDSRAYSKFSAYGLLNHDGDFRAASRALAANGYGSRRQAEAPPPNGGPGPDDEEDLDEVGGEVPPHEFPLEVLPACLAEYARQAGLAMDCPVDYAAVSMLVIAGSAIGNTRAVAVTRKWLESPRIFAALVGDPGGGKSPSLNLISEPMVEFQNVCRQEFDQQLAEYEIAAEEWEFLRKEKSRGRDVEVPCKPQRPAERHLYTTDPTMEALFPMLVANPRGFLVLRDEISSWATSMNQYKGGKGSDRQHWLQLWSGETSKSDRKSSQGTTGSMIAYKPFISIIGGIQPDMLGELSDEQGREDGFVHRILFCYPKERDWSERIGEAPAENLEADWVRCLQVIYSWDQEYAEGDVPRARVVHMDPGATAVSRAWYAEHVRERNGANFPSALNGPWSKLRSYYFRFALLLHGLRLAAGEVSCETIDSESATKAWMLIEYFKSHMKRVYGRLHSFTADVQAERLITWICRNGGKARCRDLIHARHAKKMTQAHELLADLADRQMGTYVAKQPANGGHSVWEFTASKVRMSMVASDERTNT